MAEEGRFSWVAVGMLLVGSLLSTIGGYVSNTLQTSSQLKITQVQQEYQMKQLLFSTRIAALKAYGAAVTKSNITIAQSILDLKASLRTANSSQAVAIQAIKDYRKIWEELFIWKRETLDEARVLEILFKKKPPKIEPLTLDVFNLSEDDINKLNDEKERNNEIARMKKSLDIMFAYTVQFVKEATAYIDSVSKAIRGDD